MSEPDPDLCERCLHARAKHTPITGGSGCSEVVGVRAGGYTVPNRCRCRYFLEPGPTTLEELAGYDKPDPA